MLFLVGLKNGDVVESIQCYTLLDLKTNEIQFKVLCLIY